MIHQYWWKILGSLLVLYTIIAGLLVPLKPGIVEVTPSAVRTGDEVVIIVHGYNSHFKEAEASLRAWLKLDNENAISASGVQVVNESLVKLNFDIPTYLPHASRVKDAALLMDNQVDGAFVLPSAVFITQDSIDPALAKTIGKNTEVQNLHKVSKFNFPYRNILAETIRNVYYHVPMWFSMVLLFLGSVWHSVRYLRFFRQEDDLKAIALTRIGVLFGILGLITGAIWAKNTWGEYWSWDVKQNMAAIALLIYFAYFVLRNSFDDPEKKGRLSAAYNIFAFVALIPLIYVLPRMTDSLHPGAGGNPALGGEDLDNTMRLVFYPAVIGWTLIGYWIASLVFRAERIRLHLLEK